MQLITHIIIYLNITFYILLPVRFYKTKYFLYFLLLASIDPFTILLQYFIKFDSSFFLPLGMSLSLFALPIKDKKHVIVAAVSTLLLTPLFSRGSVIPTLISSANAVYIVYFLVNEMVEEYRISSTIHYFLPLMIFDVLKDSLKIYLYYQHTTLLIDNYLYFLILGMIIPILLTYFGPNKKSDLTGSLLGSHSEKASVINQTNTSQGESESKGVFSSLTKRELDVLAYLSLGFKPQEIAEHLFVDRKTVYYHLANIKEKLNIPSTPKLTHFAIENTPNLSKIKHLEKILAPKNEN